MSTEPTPSLFPAEWRARFGAELQQLLTNIPDPDRNAIEAQFLQTHPPIFGGVYTTPTILLGSTPWRRPRLMRRDNQIHIALWPEQDAEQVLEVIAITHHRLVALVLRHELIIIRADHYEQAVQEADERGPPNAER